MVKAGHKAGRAPIAMSLRHYPVILPTRDAIIRKNADEYLAALGLAGLEPAVETCAGATAPPAIAALMRLCRQAVLPGGCGHIACKIHSETRSIVSFLKLVRRGQASAARSLGAL